MSSFLQYGNVYPEVQNTILSRAGNNLLVSQLKPWIRVSSSYNNGLVIASNLQFDTFEARYGEPVTLTTGFTHDSGRVGNNFAGDAVWPRTTSFSRQYRPSPVIEAISVKNGTEGLSRKLTFTIKVFTLPQLDMITAYFLEPRFYCLAEWGWNTQLAYNQMAKIQNTGVSSAVCDIISYINLGTLKDKRKNSQGHYDAFLGVITGGSIDYGEDETYLVNVEVVTQGEIPAYLQQHKGTPLKIEKQDGKVKDIQPNKSSELFDPQADIQSAESAGEYGQALFMYMYNRLPLAKRIPRIKKYVEDPIWTAEYNYINMNQTAREKFTNDLVDERVRITNREYNGSNDADPVTDTKIPDSQPLIGNESFIRMELAWEILNTTDLILSPQEIGCGGNNKKSPDSQISIENTIIRAHKHMFSVNKDYLYVPNAQAPDFGLYDVLQSTNDLSSSFLRFEDGQLATINLEPTDLPEAHKFPQPIECKVEGIKVFDNSVFEINQDAYEWGYLKDLFINFDFFVSCMNKNGYVIKDVAIDILNGLSSGVNLFWDFQIVETGSTSTKNKNSGDICLVVVDKNFSGKPPGNFNSTLSLNSIGTRSPFLDFKMKMEVAGAIANQVMAQTNHASSPEMSSYNVEDKVDDFRGLFAKKPDRVGSILNTIHKESIEYARKEAQQQDEENEQEVPTTLELYRLYSDMIEKVSAGQAELTWEMYHTIDMFTYVLVDKGYYEESLDITFSLAGLTISELFSEGTNYVVEGESTAETQTRKTNYDVFMQNAGVYPLINNPDVNFNDWAITQDVNSLIIDETTIVCAVWQDTQLLRQIYEYDLRGGGTIDYKVGASKNPGFLPIEVNFTIHGVSGIKVGDMLHFRDLPAIYRSKVFSVFEVEQTLNDDMWQTNVNARLRPIDYIPGSI